MGIHQHGGRSVQRIRSLLLSILSENRVKMMVVIHRVSEKVNTTDAPVEKFGPSYRIASLNI